MRLSALNDFLSRFFVSYRSSPGSRVLSCEPPSVTLSVRVLVLLPYLFSSPLSIGSGGLWSSERWGARG